MGGGHGRMNKTIPCGGVPLWGYFSMWAVFSLHVDAIFSVCCGGYVWSDIWTSHVIYNCHHQRSGLPPPNFFCWNPYNCYHIFFTSQTFIFLPDSGGFNFFKEVIFSFLEGGGLREGGRLLSTFRLFLREHAGPGGYS